MLLLQLTTLQPPKLENTMNIDENEMDTKRAQKEITLAEAAELPCNCEKRPECLHTKAIEGLYMFIILLLFLIDLRTQLQKQGMTLEQIDAMRINLDDILQYQRAYMAVPDPLNLPSAFSCLKFNLYLKHHYSTSSNSQNDRLWMFAI
jgi:hypothetical protein